MDSREHALECAIRDLESGVLTSVRGAARAYGIPRSSLQSRMQGRQSHATAHSNQQRLTPEQEASLVDWILVEDSRAKPPSHLRVREMAMRILHMNGDYRPLGKMWVPHFISRNPRISSMVGRSIESSRTTAANYDTIQAFLQLFERTRVELGIQLEDIWNMDETGVALGVCTNSQVLASSKKKKAYKSSPEDREWVSIIEVISAAGQRLQCLVIFKGKHLQTTWFPVKDTPDWLYTTSENGWTSQKIGYEWLQRIFIPGSVPSSKGYRLLILDGHGSHVPIDFMILCKEHKIHLLYLPAHASHLLQPLDLAPFSVLKTRYRRQISDLSALDDAAPVKKERFVVAYNQAREEGLSSRVIRAGWRAAGLSPYNPSLVLSSSQIVGRPVTPPPPDYPLDQENQYITTPKSAQALHQQRVYLQRTEQLSRQACRVLGKAGKAIAAANTRAAMLQAENQGLRFQLQKATDSTRVRKRVQVDMNERFSTLNHVQAALERAAAHQSHLAATAKQRHANKVTAERAANQIAQEIDKMCTEFQL
jgi:hypothetical protein